MVSQCDSLYLKMTLPLSSYISEASGDNSGKSVCMMLKSSFLETELNMLVRSINTAAREGVSPLRWGWIMNLSKESCITFIMKFIPLGTPTA